MSKKRLVGLYIGVNSVGGVVIENKKVVSALTYQLSSLEMETKIDTINVEGINEDIKWEALINRLLRDLNVEEKEIYVSYSDKDFIFRSLEMPLMSEREIASSLIYEIEKYIPFKLEELRWDYFYVKLPKEKKVIVSFVGIRESNFQRVADILTHLGLTPIALESASVSLFRIIDRVKELATIKNFALLDFNPLESYITFFSQRLPVFNRYFVLNDNASTGQPLDLEKFIESIRFSFQYFKREYKNYELEKIIVISDALDESVKKFLEEEMQTQVKVFAPIDFTAITGSSIESVKAQGIAAREYLPFKLRPILRNTESHISGETFQEEVFFNKNMLSTLIVMGVIATIGVFSFLKYNAVMEKNKISIEEKKIAMPDGLKNAPWPEQKVLMDNLKNKVIRIKGLKKYSPKIQAFVESLKYVTPKGVWLDNLDFSYSEDSKSVICVLKGNAFLGDAYEERTAINDFVSGLKSQGAVTSLFSSINMISSERQQMKDFSVTIFSLELS